MTKANSENVTPTIDSEYDFRKFYQKDLPEVEKDAIYDYIEQKYAEYVHFASPEVLIELEANPFWRIDHSEVERQIRIKTEIQRIIDIVNEFPIDDKAKAGCAEKLMDNLAETLRERREAIDYGFFNSEDYLHLSLMRHERTRPTFNIPF